MESKTQRLRPACKRRWLCVFFVASALLITLNFTLPLLVGEKCWSPNREYFVVKVESLWSRTFYAPGTKFGWLLVFNRRGRLEHRWRGNFFSYALPTWKENFLMIDERRLVLSTVAAHGKTQKSCFCVFEGSVPNACQSW